MDHYPLLINFQSAEFKEIEKKLEDILEEVTAKLMGTVIYPNNDSMGSLVINNSIKVTFTFDHDDMHFYIRADGLFDSWNKDLNQTQQPSFNLTNFEITRYSYPSNDDINAALTYIFFNNKNIKKKYSKLVADAVAEYRNERAIELKNTANLLLSGPRYEW